MDVYRFWFYLLMICVTYVITSDMNRYDTVTIETVIPCIVAHHLSCLQLLCNDIPLCLQLVNIPKTQSDKLEYVAHVTPHYNSQGEVLALLVVIERSNTKL